MKKSNLVLLLIISVIVFTGCADVTPVQDCIDVANAEGSHEYGFLGGLWHGMIAPFAFIGSWFSDDIAVWAINNNGGWYTFGFLFGVGGFSSGTYYSSKK
jgi:hypothetical protein